MPTDATVTNLVVALKALPKSRRTGATFRVTGNILSVYDKEGMALADVCVTPDGEMYVERHTL